MQTLETKTQIISVPKETMQAMRLYNSKETVYSMSEKHTVMLLFMRHSLCCFAVEMMHDIYELLPELAKLNTVPIFVHQEPSDAVVQRLQDNKTPNLITCEDPTGKTFYEAFGVGRAANMGTLVATCIGRIAYNHTRGYVNTIPTEMFNGRVDNLRYPGIFIIENGQVLNQYYYPYAGAKGDYLGVLIDPEKKGKAKQEMNLDNVPDLQKLFPKLEDKKVVAEQENVACFAPKSFSRKSQAKVTNVKELMQNKKRRSFFKIHVTKEHSVENFLFWEECEKYKQCTDIKKRTEMAQKIIKSFITNGSILELNITDNLRKEVTQKLESEGPIVTLFDKAILDIELTVLTDSFQRFKHSDLFTKMNK